MNRNYLLLSIVWFILLTGCGGRDVSPIARALSEPAAFPTKISDDLTTPPDSCPITRPPEARFVPPEPYPQYAPWANDFWFGDAALWTAVPGNGVWSNLPHHPEGYTQKIFWWREGYSVTEEPEPQLVVTGQRLDDSAPPLNASSATNAYASDIKTAMLVGVDFPTLGCWQITGQYADQKLSFVVWIAP